MTMPENIQTDHTQSDRSTKETKGRCKQADTDNPNSSKDLLIELITKAQVALDKETADKQLALDAL